MKTLEQVANEIQQYIASKGISHKFETEISTGSYRYAPDRIRRVLMVYETRSYQRWGEYICAIEPDIDKDTFNISYLMAGNSRGYSAQDVIDKAIREIDRNNR